MTAVITAYCACQLCCGHYSGSPTASGIMPVQGVTIAAPPHVKFNTKVHIEGLGIFTVQDRTAKRFQNRWDIYFKDHESAIKFGKQHKRITIIK